VGLDIGGANLKAAHHAGPARSRPFSLWKDPAGLADALRGLLAELPAFERLAVAMTGELCDCFETKRQGVHAILDAVQSVAAGRPIRVWQTTGRFVDLATARAQPLDTAAANWLALAAYVGRYVPEGPALLIDVGSTTTDIVPLRDGRPIPQARSDPERLRTGELVYTGVRRTPLCALLGAGHAAELFATTLDAYLVLGRIPEDAADHGTADGRPATRAAAEARLARMIAADLETCSDTDRLAIARQSYEAQKLLIAAAVKQVMPSPRAMVLAGEGEFLARDVLAGFTGRIESLQDRLGPEVSRSACAYALAVLASEEDG
jgi:probable H4MPT-linked C1 transfer pathway protein